MGSLAAISLQDQDQSWGRDIAATISRALQMDQARVSRLQPQAPQYVVDNVSEDFQSSSPSSVPQTYAEHDGMPSPTSPKNFGASAGPTTETRTELHRALTVHVTDPAKIVARKTGASPDTVDHHRQGNVPQSWSQMIAYCRAYPAFGLEVLDLMGIDIGRDREAYSIFLSLQRQMMGQ